MCAVRKTLETMMASEEDQQSAHLKIKDWAAKLKPVERGRFYEAVRNENPVRVWNLVSSIRKKPHQRILASAISEWGLKGLEKSLYGISPESQSVLFSLLISKQSITASHEHLNTLLQCINRPSYENSGEPGEITKDHILRLIQLHGPAKVSAVMDSIKSEIGVERPHADLVVTWMKAAERGGPKRKGLLLNIRP